MFVALFVIGMAVLLLAQVAPFPFIFDSIGPATTIWSMPQQDAAPTVYLSFDDGPNPTATLLCDRTLRDRRHGSILRRMFAEGQAVGLHSHTRVLAALPPDDLAQLLTEMADRIEEVVGDRPCPVFRPHAGWRSWSMLTGRASIDTRWLGGDGGSGTIPGFGRPTRRRSPSDLPIECRTATSLCFTTVITSTPVPNVNMQQRQSPCWFPLSATEGFA